MEEQPLFVVDAGSSHSDMAAQIKALPAVVRSTALGLCHRAALPDDLAADLRQAAEGDAEAEAVLRVVTLTGFGRPGGGTGVYPTAGRANHSCRPNVAWRVERGGALRFVAIRRIAAGEEVVDTYLREADLLRPVQRRRQLLARWGFHCQCVRCTGLDDTRAFLCPSCGKGSVLPPVAGDGQWSACRVCGTVPDGARLAEAEERWSRRPWRGRRSALELYASLNAAHRRCGAAAGAAEGEPMPRLDGHWVAAQLAREASEALLARGSHSAAAEAARWPWRFAKRALAGAASSTAAEAMASRAAAAALEAALGAHRDAAAQEACQRRARWRFHAALREAEVVLRDGDELLERLRRHASA